MWSELSLNISHMLKDGCHMMTYIINSAYAFSLAYSFFIDFYFSCIYLLFSGCLFVSLLLELQFRKSNQSTDEIALAVAH